MDWSKYHAKPDKTIEEHNQELLKTAKLLRELGYIHDERGYALLVKACEYHDQGKANPVFQARVRQTEGKKIFFDPQKEVIHNVLSIYSIDVNQFQEKIDYCRVVYAVLYHHDYGDPLEEIREKQQLIQLLLQELPSYEIKKSVMKTLIQIGKEKETILLKGFLHKCDYSASGGYQSEYPNDFLETSMEGLLEKWKKHALNAKWNDMQMFCIKNREENIMVTAQTGMGKTEAGLLWMGNHKGYFVLPLQTAINAIYDRVKKEVLENKNLNERLCILHASSIDHYIRTIEQEELNLEEYERRGKQYSLPLSISTMDQLFDFLFLYQGYELKLTTLSYSKLVIDEIQMYDPELLAFLVAGLERIWEMGGKIAILTATLSPFVKHCLRRIPFKTAVFTDDAIRHHLVWKEEKINAEDIWELYIKNEENEKSNKILVICNTIKKAQELYKKLEEISVEANIKIKKELLHSRYIKKDRADKEHRILQFGKTFHEDGNLDRQSGIWISTSLVEASLDIDFDYMITELQDLSSLFQRMGRCNRKGQKDTEEWNCLIYTEIDTKYLTSSSNGFIDDIVFRLSKEAVKSLSGKVSEIDKNRLIETYLAVENLKGSDYQRKYECAYEKIEAMPLYKFNKNEVNFRNIIQQTIIPSPVFEQNKELITNILDELYNRELTSVEKIQRKEELLNYTLSIPYYEWMKYRKEIARGNAETMPVIRVSKYEEIPVMECNYDDMGYWLPNYDEISRTPNFL